MLRILLKPMATALTSRWVIKPLRLFTELFTEAASSPELAYGFALGMLVGLVPKDNLLALILATMVLLFRVNLGTATLGAFLFSWLGMWLDPLSNEIGRGLLTWKLLEPMWTFLYGVSWVSWTRFNNTVVLGSLLLGVSLFFPVGFLARVTIDRCRYSATDPTMKWSVP